jgi:hypothetical protein
MIKKSWFLLGIIFIGFVNVSLQGLMKKTAIKAAIIKKIAGDQATVSHDSPAVTSPINKLIEYPLCISLDTRPHEPKSKYLHVSPDKQVFTVVGKTIVDKKKATLWKEIRLTQPKPNIRDGMFVCGGPEEYTAVLKAVDPSGYLACKADGELYLSSSQEEMAVWNASGRSSMGYTPVYTSKKYGYVLNAAIMILKGTRVIKLRTLPLPAK